MPATNRLLATLCTFVIFMLAGGCAAPLAVTAGMSVAQAGSGAYSAGELRAGRYATVEEGWKAAQLALADLEVETDVTDIRDRRRYVRAREPGGPHFRITVERKSPMAIRIRIRVGLIGDVSLSRLTMRRIDYHLTRITDSREFHPPAQE